jgi:hypothetical protein
VARRRAARLSAADVRRRYGTRSVVTGLAQHRVVPTGRGTEVAADPTTGLALEAAVRRSGSAVVRLATVQRVVRAQRVAEGLFAHFSLFGAVTAGHWARRRSSWP